MKPSLQAHPDFPKMLADPRARANRRSQMHEAHVAPLTKFVEALRAQVGPDAAIPDFDPWDGGVDAEVLYLLEAPGAKAVASGFISRNNPDETAKNFFLLNEEVGIPRKRTITWNIVPGYIGSETRIRAANRADIVDGSASLEMLLSLLPRLRAVVLTGRKAERAAARIKQARPDVCLFTIPHPSPLFINNAPGNRERILSKLREVAQFIDAPPTSGYSDVLAPDALPTFIDRLRNHSVFDEAQRALVAYRAARDKLLELGVIRSERSAAGDYGEWLAAEALGLTLAASGVQAGFDATDANGKTYQIKTRIVRDPNAAHHSTSRNRATSLIFWLEFFSHRRVICSHSCGFLQMKSAIVPQLIKEAGVFAGRANAGTNHGSKSSTGLRLKGNVVRQQLTALLSDASNFTQRLVGTLG